MTNVIKINKPYIKNNADKSRLCSDLELPSGKFELYYEVEKEYEKYLCTERVNSFVLGILEYAMYLGCDIESEIPIDEELYYNLVNYGIPIMSQNLDFMNYISLKVPFTSEKYESEGAVGTGFSAGVDSFYSILKHLNPKEKSFKLTHLLIANVGAFTYRSTEESKIFFEKQVENLYIPAKEMKLPLIAIDTNYNDLYLTANAPNIKIKDSIYGGTPLKNSACVYALQKLFRIYYQGSTTQLDRFLFGKDPGWALIFYMRISSSSNMKFLDSGTEVNRIQKVEYISDNPVVQKYLSVDFGKNCNRCNKCLRTMFELYAINRLEKYSQVFDVDDFKNHLSNRLAEYFNSKNDKYDGFIKESIDMCKKNNIKIPISSYIKSYLIFKPFLYIKSELRKSSFVRRIYYSLDLDLVLHGKDAKQWRNKQEL